MTSISVEGTERRSQDLCPRLGLHREHEQLVGETQIACVLDDEGPVVAGAVGPSRLWHLARGVLQAVGHYVILCASDIPRCESTPRRITG